MDWLTQVARHHSVYIGYVKGMGAKTHAEDIVQECYLRLHEYSSADKCITNGKVNKHYVWRVLYSLFADYYKASKSVKVYSIEFGDETHTMPDIGMEKGEYLFGQSEKREDAFLRLTGKMMKSIHGLDEESKYPYNAEMFFLWSGYDDLVQNREGRREPLSMREIEKLTGISLTSIFNTMKACKVKIKEDLLEDWIDFKNGDYDKI